MSARDALRESVETNRAQQALTDESRVLLTALIREEMRNEMRLAVTEGIAAAMTEEAAEAFWRTGLSVLQRQATQHTGQIVGGAVLALLKRGALFLLLGGIVYAIGGWSALAGLGKFLLGDK